MKSRVETDVRIILLFTVLVCFAGGVAILDELALSNRMPNTYTRHAI